MFKRRQKPINENHSGENSNSAVADTNAAEKQKKPFRDRIRDSGLFDGFFLFCILTTLMSVAVYTAARLWQPFAEFFTRYPATYLRAIFGTITSLVPFSIAEFLLLASPAIAVAYIVSSYKAMKRDTSTRMFVKKMKAPVCAVLLIISTFMLNFATGYFRTPLDKNLGLEKTAVSADELAETAMKISAEITEIEKSVNFVYGGSSYMPYSYDMLIERLNEAYSDYSIQHDFINNFWSKPKPVAMSIPMTYGQIAGVYTFFTGEANINIHYPDYVLPYTVAHEMAHQRGIAREDEANLLAFVVSMESTDNYIRYSALLNVQEYVLSALRKADKDKYNAVYSAMPKTVKGELRAYSVFFDKYKNKTVSKVTSTVNNAFLQSQGQTEGIKSYGLVVDSIVAYYSDK